MTKRHWILGGVLVALTACAGPPTREQTGAMLGGVGGGILGSQVGDGKGRTAAIIAGTLLGAELGKEVARSIEPRDEERAARALDQNRRETWVNPDTGTQVTVVPKDSFRGAKGEECRDYSTEVVVQGRTEVAEGRACRQADGSWELGQAPS